MNEIIQLQPRGHGFHDIPAALRKIADEMEAGDFDVITTCVVCFGHTKTVPTFDGTVLEDITNVTFSMGPRSDSFTIRGLLMASAIGLTSE